MPEGRERRSIEYWHRSSKRFWLYSSLALKRHRQDRSIAGGFLHFSCKNVQILRKDQVTNLCNNRNQRCHLSNRCHDLQIHGLDGVRVDKVQNAGYTLILRAFTHVGCPLHVEDPVLLSNVVCCRLNAGRPKRKQGYNNEMSMLQQSLPYIPSPVRFRKPWKKLEMTVESSLGGFLHTVRPKDSIINRSRKQKAVDSGKTSSDQHLLAKQVCNGLGHSTI
jgi:hypothetical protein